MSFFRLETGVSTSASNVTPSVSGRFNSPARQLYVGNGGDLNVRLESDSSYNLLRNFPTGGFLLASVVAVSNVNTTASNIVAFI